MGANEVFVLPVFIAVSSFTLLVLMLVAGRRSRIDVRLDELSGKSTIALDQENLTQLARFALPALGAPLMPEDNVERTCLQARLMHAGLYSRQAMVLFLGVKMLLILAPPLLGVALGILGVLPIRNGLIFGALFGISGMIGPSFWLDHRKKKRQTSFRRALPDALDVLVICMEGGLSLQAALRRVAGELQTAHPLLSNELNIVQRQMQLGRSTGEAMRQFADRADLEELRGLASVIIQAERFGASLVKSLRVHADALRYKRLLSAEEKAQKAAIKMLFPTVLCIFPGIFIVILGPAAIQIMDLFRNINGH